MKQIIAALLNAQKSIKNALQDSTNPHFKSRFASLESVLDTVKGPLIENEILLLQSVRNDALANAPGPVLITMLLHSSGERLESAVPLIQNKPDLHGLGGAITYLRRQGIKTMLGITEVETVIEDSVEDDDGNRGSVEESKSVGFKEVVPGRSDLPFDTSGGGFKTPANASSAKTHTKATADDIDALRSAIRASGWTPDQVKAYSASVFGKSQSKDLTPEEIGKLITNIKIFNFEELMGEDKDD